MRELSVHQEAARYSVRGWLLFLWISLVLGLVLSLGSLVVRLSFWLPNAHRYSNNVLLLVIDTVLVVCLAALGMHAAIALMRVKRTAVPWTKSFLVVFLIHSVSSVSVPFAITGVPFDREAVYVQVAVAIIGSILAVFIWYSYLSRSKRVAATYGAAQIEHAVRSHLTGIRDLSQAVPIRRDGFSTLTALGFFIATLFSVQVFSTLVFLMYPETVNPRSRPGAFTDAFTTGLRGARLLVELPGALLFTAILGLTTKRWQLAAAWALSAGLLAVVSNGLGLAAIPHVATFFGAEGEMPGAFTMSRALEAFLYGGINGLLVIAGLMIVIGVWGLRGWSVAIGWMAGEIAFWIVQAMAFSNGLALDVTLVGAGAAALVYGILVYRGIFLHHVTRYREWS
ncbi:MAG TPA: DUF2569 family protein [Vicinamibacterales bacterium]